METGAFFRVPNTSTGTLLGCGFELSHLQCKLVVYNFNTCRYFGGGAIVAEEIAGRAAANSSKATKKAKFTVPYINTFVKPAIFGQGNAVDVAIFEAPLPARITHWYHLVVFCFGCRGKEASPPSEKQLAYQWGRRNIHNCVCFFSAT